MSKLIEQTQLDDQIVSLETGNWAKQANGSIVYRCGKLVLLATVCAEMEAREGQSFFPLTVDYREKFYAAGRIPGGYFKRENRPAEHEILISRLIDRPCRPLFPEGYFCEVQLLINLLSFDPAEAVEGHAITAASSALMLSNIPWDGPVAGTLVGRVDGKFIADPDSESREKSDLDLLIAGSKNAITMIEGSAKEYSNADMLSALEFAHKSIAHKLEVQEKLAKSAAVQKVAVSLNLPDKALSQEVHDFAYGKIQAANQTSEKHLRKEKIDAVCKETTEHFKQKLMANQPDNSDEVENKLNQVKEELHTLEYLVVRSLIFEKGIRADGRKLDEIRPISVELDPLPGSHSSVIFTRGETQSLGVVTLGTQMDNQRYETLEGQKLKNFILHYNFPPFSTGEVKRIIGPGRREIGHGNLAWRALKQVIPNEEEFPYVIRIVSEILESNGSSSMASVCSGSLAMMAAGIPISTAVSGIAMGLMSDDKGNTAILSDIAGLEDHFGDMDLKVAGTEKGITAFQLDLKVKGIKLELLQQALEQAERGRLHILQEMNKACPQPRAELPKGAPCISSMQIDPTRIGDIVGPGGRIIREIIERTGADINIADDGKVKIASTSPEANKNAENIITNILREPQEGDTYNGKVKRVTEFGAFIELYPGKEGLLHISKMSERRLTSVEEVMKEGDQVPIMVLGIDRMGRVDLCHQDLDLAYVQSNDDRRGNRSNSDNKRPMRSSGRHSSRDNSRHGSSSQHHKPSGRSQGRHSHHSGRGGRQDDRRRRY